MTFHVGPYNITQQLIKTKGHTE